MESRRCPTASRGACQGSDRPHVNVQVTVQNGGSTDGSAARRVGSITNAILCSSLTTRLTSKLACKPFRGTTGSRNLLWNRGLHQGRRSGNSAEKCPFLEMAPQQRRLTDPTRRAAELREPSSPRSMPLARHLLFHSNNLLALSFQTKSSTKHPVSTGLKSRRQTKPPAILTDS